jgi:hypothetical protein
MDLLPFWDRYNDATKMAINPSDELEIIYKLN